MDKKRDYIIVLGLSVFIICFITFIFWSLGNFSDLDYLIYIMFLACVITSCGVTSILLKFKPEIFTGNRTMKGLEKASKIIEVNYKIKHPLITCSSCGISFILMGAVIRKNGKGNSVFDLLDTPYCPFCGVEQEDDGNER